VCVCVFLCFFVFVLFFKGSYIYNISAMWPFCPVEHLLLRIDVICITCNRLRSQINDADDDDDVEFYLARR